MTPLTVPELLDIIQGHLNRPVLLYENHYYASPTDYQHKELLLCHNQGSLWYLVQTRYEEEHTDGDWKKCYEGPSVIEAVRAYNELGERQP